jgi:hypothetical protein
MNISRLFRRGPESAARTLAQHGAELRHTRERLTVRARVDEMRVNLGLDPVRWPK